MPVIGLIKRLIGCMYMPPPPAIVTLRAKPSSRVAIVFLHGFAGSPKATWGKFPALLASRPELSEWDIYSLGYASSLRLDVPHVWTADPPLELISLSFRTAIGLPPLARYRSLALIAHSMGGLVAQHALLDPRTALRVSFLILFGTPSGGLRKALLGGFLKRQVRDMQVGGKFITRLRRNWSNRYSASSPFVLRVVAGERDEFVPGSSSLSTFPPEVQCAVPGDHLAIVKPESDSDRSVQLVIETLCETASAIGLVDSARLAVERSDFAGAVNVLLPRAAEIDDGALVQLALALERLGRSGEALQVLEDRFAAGKQPSTDAYGVLAGRLKRRWLVERGEADWTRARELYQKALNSSAHSTAAESSTSPKVAIDADQAMYHAINIAFLDLMWSPPASTVPQHVKDMAARARKYAEQAADSHWRAATFGDSHAILGDLDSACLSYTRACQLASSPRDIQSMYTQALRIGDRIYGGKGISAVQHAFWVRGVE